MAAYTAVVSLMNTIQDVMNHPRISTFFDKKQIQHLLEKTSLLLDFIEANNDSGSSKEADELEMEIASAAQAAEDVIDLHIMDQIYAKTNLRYLLDLEQRNQDMEGIMKKANEFKGKQRRGEEQRTPLLPVMEIEETAMVGLDAELQSLLDELTREPKSSRKTISIVGMGGMGKTTLAKNIFENKLIKHHFDFLGWANISQHHNTQEIIAQLLSQSGEDSEELHKKLFGRRYLIILDDIWSVKAWHEVSRYFPDNNNGSRIVLTTRLSNVANDCGSSPFMMRFLDEAESWKLYCERAFKNESCPPQLWKVGEKIVKLCKGLALSIVVIGGLLSKSPRTVEYWEGVLNDIKSISGSKEKQESLDALYLSYNHLPAHLKPCFLYMGVFKEDSEINMSKVVRLWVGEGFIKPNGSEVLLEDIGEGFMKDLIERNLILVGRRSKNGKLKYCGMHDLLRELCIKLGEQQQFFSVFRYDETPDPTAHRLIAVGGSVNFGNDRIPEARSILGSSWVGQPVKHKLLRVLNIEGWVYLEEDLSENVNLRHLAYEQLYSTDAEELLTSVSLMWNLQTLTIISGLGLVAPAEIWKMRQLRHVMCPSIYLPPCDGQDEDELLNLQTLKTASNLRLCTKVCKIVPNITKLYLRYDDDDDDDGKCGYDDSLVEHLCNLDRMHKLQSLKLVFQPWRWTSSDAKLIKKLAFPSFLKILSLEGCGFDWDDMKMIGLLPQLEVLTLGEDTISKGDTWSPITGQFLRLKVLSISDINGSLKYWDADNSHFPVLEKLRLSAMINLKEIALGIGDIPTLEIIQVKYCSMSAAISAVKIKEDQLDIGNDTLQIQVTVYPSEVVDFKERMESEGLSIANIQLETY